ncbi:hypothetical protein [Prosthecobacter sp.]|uniref:hypothetical protein n=1 Tax=Prosthecobacter sp. TaxID=1965333 RepID=UPI003783423E
MYEQKLKHLEFIQAVITRMNSNSFLLKGWSVSLVSAIFALAAKDANIRYAIIAYIPVIIFWALDGFFLSQEKQYRKLYEAVAAKDESQIDFSMNASSWNSDGRTWGKTCISKTLLPFHGALVLVVAIVMFVIPRLG